MKGDNFLCEPESKIKTVRFVIMVLTVLGGILSILFGLAIRFEWFATTSCADYFAPNLTNEIICYVVGSIALLANIVCIVIKYMKCPK